MSRLKSLFPRVFAASTLMLIVAIGLFWLAAIRNYSFPSLLSAALVILTMSAALAFFVSREFDKQTNSLNTMRDQWTQQIREAATLEERNRLARELHDSIKQQIFTINVGVAAAQARLANDRAGASEALIDVRNSTKEAMTEMNALLQQLSPQPLENVGLVQAIRQQGEALAYRTGAQVETDFDALPPNDALPIGTQESLFRITQEALANIARHARAKLVSIHLRQQRRGSGDGVLLEIEDDGQGFDQMRVERGMGLGNIRTRAEQLSGQFELMTAPERGTRLRVWVPLALKSAERPTDDLPESAERPEDRRLANLGSIFKSLRP